MVVPSAQARARLRNKADIEAPIDLSEGSGDGVSFDLHRSTVNPVAGYATIRDLIPQLVHFSFAKPISRATWLAHVPNEEPQARSASRKEIHELGTDHQ
jgi:hypothetical protein